MSDVAFRARQIIGRFLPPKKTIQQIHRNDVDRALQELKGLVPVDAHDEMAVGEAGEILLRLLDQAVE